MNYRHNIVTEVLLEGKDARELLSAPDLRDALKGGEVNSIFKYGSVSQSRGGEIKEIHEFSGEFITGERPIGTCVITASTEDRDRDIVFSDGMIITEGYRKNPVVLPMHNYREFPIGFTKKISQYMKHVTAIWEWLTDQPDTQAAQYYRLWEAHVLNATSIGFIPTLDGWKWVEDRFGFDFVEWELLEHSIVTIPSNPQAERSISGAKQYRELVGEALIESSPIVRRSIELALSGGKTVSVKLPEIDKDASETDDEIADVEPEVDNIDTESAVPDEGAADEVDETSQEEGEEAEEKSVPRLLSAFAAGVLTKDETASLIEQRIKEIEDERDIFRKSAAELSLSIIQSNSEV